MANRWAAAAAIVVGLALCWLVATSDGTGFSGGVRAALADVMP